MAGLRTASRVVSLAGSPAHSRAESNIFINEPTSGSLARSKGSLYIITETEGDTRAERSFCRLVSDSVRGEYYRDPAQELEEAISRGIERGNAKMLHDDRLPPEEGRPVVALTCLAIRDGELAIAQTLPVQTYLGSRNGVALVPDPPVWESDAAELTSAFYLGFARTVRYHLYSATLGSGDMIAVCSSALAQSLTTDRLERWLTSGETTTLSHGLRANYLHADKTPAYALVVQTRPDGREAAIRGSEESAGRAKRSTGAWPPGPLAGSPSGQRDSSTPGADVARRAIHHPIGSAARPGDRPNQARRPASGGPPSRPGSRPRPTFAVPGLGTASGRRIIAAIIGLIVLAIVVILAVKGVQRFQAGREHSAYATVSGQVEQLLTQAGQQQDPAAAEATLKQAQTVVSNNGGRLNPTDQQDLKTRIQQREDLLVKASRLTHVKVLTDLSGDPQVALSHIALEGANVFVLDTGGRRVLKVTTTGGQPVAALQAGAVVGSDTIKPLVAITAIPGGVMAVDSQNAVWSFDAGTNRVRRVSVPGSDAWGNVQAITTYNNELYVLDTRLSRVWRYTPQGEGYGTPVDYFAQLTARPVATVSPTPRARLTATPEPTPQPTPTPPDLVHGVDLAVDGSLYILQAGGSVIKYTNGLPERFPETGLVAQMPSASEVIASPTDTSVWVVDPSGKRIVRFTKSGVFQRQYLLPADAPAALTGIQGAAIDTAHQTVYLISNKVIAVATLPAQ